MTFGQKTSKLNRRPVYCSRLYGTYSPNKFMYAHSQVCLYKKVLYKRDKIVGKVSLWSSTFNFTLKKWYYVPFDKSTHSDLNDQNLFHSTIDVPQGCQGCQISGQPNWSPLWWVGALRFSQNWRKVWKTVKIYQKLSKKPCFLKVFQISFNLG